MIFSKCLECFLFLPVLPVLPCSPNPLSICPLLLHYSTIYYYVYLLSLEILTLWALIHFPTSMGIPSRIHTKLRYKNKRKYLIFVFLVYVTSLRITVLSSIHLSINFVVIFFLGTYNTPPTAIHVVIHTTSFMHQNNLHKRT